MYQALYRTFRPDTFDQVLGQEHIVKILKNQINRDTVGHAYLFCGTRGTGKTSLARILAKGVNCLAPAGQRPCGICENCQAIRNGVMLDVIEIDAASNNGVDNIRELRESVNYPPAAGRRKVYIIDEVHMLTTPAFNALLKTLEEPPAHVMFILATTESQKLPATILSRCMRLDFHRVPESEARLGLERICRELSIDLAPDAAGLIVRSADGSMRDALSLLDQCVAAGNGRVERATVLAFLGAAGEAPLLELTDYVITGDVAGALRLINQLLVEGNDARQLIRDWIEHYRNLLIAATVDQPGDLLDLATENATAVIAQGRKLSLITLRQHILLLSETLADARWTTNPRVLLELCAVNLADKSAGSNVSQPGVRQKPTKPAPAPAPAAQVAEPAPAPAAQAAESAPAPARQIELDRLWQQMTADSAVLPVILRAGCRLAELSERTFTIETSNEINRMIVEAHVTKIEDLLAQLTGQRRQLLCRWSEPAETPLSEDEKADQISRKLGGITVKTIKQSEI